MIKYAYQYTYGKDKSKSHFLAISCPTCGSSKLVIKGKEQHYGRGFKCQECKSDFNIRMVKISELKPELAGKFKRFIGRLQHNSVSEIY